MDTETLKKKVLEARTAYQNLNPMIKHQAGPVFLPLLDTIAALAIEVGKLKGEVTNG